MYVLFDIPNICLVITLVDRESSPKISRDFFPMSVSLSTKISSGNETLESFSTEPEKKKGIIRFEVKEVRCMKNF